MIFLNFPPSSFTSELILLFVLLNFRCWKLVNLVSVSRLIVTSNRISKQMK